MKKFLGFALLFLLVFMLTTKIAEAQCAMCRATVENNISTGANRIGSGLNTGILYLMSIPYVLFLGIAYFWYRHSKEQRIKKIALAERLRQAGVSAP
ncbi:hypothetical protein [Rhodoflexus sp.]